MATPSEREKIRLSLDVSPDPYALLVSLAERTDESKSDVLRKAIVLMDVAVTASQNGKRLLVEEPSNERDYRSLIEIVGLFPPKSTR
jgi:hypothetical protein